MKKTNGVDKRELRISIVSLLLSSPASDPPSIFIQQLAPKSFSNIYEIFSLHQPGFNLSMAEGPASPGGGSPEGGELSSMSFNVREQDRFLPIANISRIMKKALPANAKMAKDAKEIVQEAVSEFISFITSEASDKCQKEKRKTISGDDLLWAMGTLGFEDYIEPLKLYLSRYKETVEPDTKGSVKAHESSVRRDGVQSDYDQNAQLAHQSLYLEGLDYGNSQGQHMMVPMQGRD
ncbi:hypothetical protein LXL04_032702 [Taraxacum kok-saghyz]